MRFLCPRRTAAVFPSFLSERSIGNFVLRGAFYRSSPLEFSRARAPAPHDPSQRRCVCRLFGRRRFGWIRAYPRFGRPRTSVALASNPATLTRSRRLSRGRRAHARSFRLRAAPARITVYRHRGLVCGFPSSTSHCSTLTYGLSFLVHLFSINPCNFACFVPGGQ